MEDIKNHEEHFEEDYEEKATERSRPMAQIIIPSTDFPSHVKARVDAMGDPEFQKRRKAHTLLMGEDLRGLPLVLHIHRICGDERWGWYTLGSGNPTVPQACPMHPHVVLDVKKQA